MPLTLAAFLFLLDFLATLRLTRLVTTDWLGEWLIARPLKAWAAKYEGPAINTHRLYIPEELGEVDPYDPHDPFSWQAKLVTVLDCPFCVGYWLGLALLIATTVVVLVNVPALTIAWAVLLGSLALNYLVGHISSRLD